MGSGPQGARSATQAKPVTSIWANPGSTRSTDSSRSGVRVSDARVTIGAPELGRRFEPLADRHCAEQILPESVSGLCILPRTATISRIRSPIRPGSPPQRSRRLRNEVESRQSRSTSSLSSNGRTGPEASRRSAGWKIGRLQHPIGPEPPFGIRADRLLPKRSANLFAVRWRVKVGSHAI